MAQATSNANPSYGNTHRAIRETLAQNYETLKKRRDRCPLKWFVARGASHPQIEELKQTIKGKDKGETERLINKLGADGWGGFRVDATRSTASAFLKYSASAHGWTPFGITPCDSTPLIVGGKMGVGDNQRRERSAVHLLRNSNLTMIQGDRKKMDGWTPRRNCPLTILRRRSAK